MTLEEFPYADVMWRLEILRSKVHRYSGNVAVWRAPDCKPDYSLLAAGVHIAGNMRTSVSISPLPQRLEKVCIALALVHYTRMGESSYIPQVVDLENDGASLAARCCCYSGLTLTRETAISELMVGPRASV